MALLNFFFLRRFTELNKILRRRSRTAHRGEIPGGGQLFITIAMPLDLAFGSAMVVLFFKDWLPHEYYSYAGLFLHSSQPLVS